jgi:hypothetical protein
VVSFTPRPLYRQGKNPRYPLYRSLGGLQSRSGRGVEEKDSQPPPGIEPPSSDPVVVVVVIIVIIIIIIIIINRYIAQYITLLFVQNPQVSFRTSGHFSCYV